MVRTEPQLGMLTRLEVWGDPIDHSLSPVLHAAAYRALGLDWDYGRRRVTEEGFAASLAAAGAGLRGLSLTMPLKNAAFAAAEVRDRRAELTGAVNTFVPRGRRGFNTDVGGLVRSVREAGVERAVTARIVGAGATARSALVALAELGAHDVDVVARRPEAVTQLADLGARMGVRVRATPFDAAAFTPVPLTLATLPGGAELPVGVAERLAASGVSCPTPSTGTGPHVSPPPGRPPARPRGAASGCCCTRLCCRCASSSPVMRRRSSPVSQKFSRRCVRRWERRGLCRCP